MKLLSSEKKSGRSKKNSGMKRSISRGHYTWEDSRSSFNFHFVTQNNACNVYSYIMVSNVSIDNTLLDHFY